jgi:hypothetical protein
MKCLIFQSSTVNETVHKKGDEAIIANPNTLATSKNKLLDLQQIAITSLSLVFPMPVVRQSNLREMAEALTCLEGPQPNWTRRREVCG